MKSASELFASPGFYPLKIDFDTGVLSFVPMTPAAYQASSFLDGRIHAAGAERYDTAVAGTLPPQPPNHCHYIFHAAFCCSTLLARYLELIPPCFVLKEPLFLTQMAVVRPRANAAHNTDGAIPRDQWPPLFDLCTRLLGRGWTPEDVVAIKVNDICNGLGETLLERNESAKAVFVTIGLRDFLLVLLKDAGRRRWLRGRLRKAVKDAAVVPELAGFDPEPMSDAEGGAYLWAVNEGLRARLDGLGGARLLTLPGEQIADEPERAVLAVSRHFGLPAGDRAAKKLISNSTAARHAKDPSRRYDAGSRRKELKVLEKQIGGEADQGVRWVERHRVMFGGRP